MDSIPAWLRSGIMHDTIIILPGFNWKRYRKTRPIIRKSSVSSWHTFFRVAVTKLIANNDIIAHTVKATSWNNFKIFHISCTWYIVKPDQVTRVSSFSIYYLVTETATTATRNLDPTHIFATTRHFSKKPEKRWRRHNDYSW